jgi:hypothetical protein
MKWVLLVIAVAALLSAGRWWRRLTEGKSRGDFSGDWWADERLKVLRRAAEFEGVSHSGKFKR